MCSDPRLPGIDNPLVLLAFGANLANRPFAPKSPETGALSLLSVDALHAHSHTLPLLVLIALARRAY